MIDGMKADQFWVDNITSTGSVTTGVLSGANVQFGAAIAAAELETDSVTADEIAASAVGQSEMAYGTIGTGSPPGYGLSCLVGSDTTGAAGSAWVVFGKKFSDVPKVVLAGATDATAGFAPAILAGSFLLSSGGTANKVYSWIAVGSGKM